MKHELSTQDDRGVERKRFSSKELTQVLLDEVTRPLTPDSCITPVTFFDGWKPVTSRPDQFCINFLNGGHET
jgi:hypothetical protein